MGANSEGEPEYAAYVSARLLWLHQLAFLLCRDRDRAEDLVQSAVTRLYVHWRKARVADNLDAYTRTIVVRVYLNEERGGWWRRVITTPAVPEIAAWGADADVAMDVRHALARLGPRQRTAVVLRYCYDLSVEQTALAMGCSTGTVKSQAARGLANLRAHLAPSKPLARIEDCP